VGEERRLKRAEDFRAVFRAGRRYGNRLVALYVLARGDEPSRVGYTTGRGIGKAVVRNRLRRRLREIGRRWEKQLGTGRDFVLVARPEAVEADFAVLKAGVLAAVDEAARQERAEG
jgi:ribonuclease P protein component